MFLDLNIDSKVLSTSRATPTQAFRITPAHHQTVFKPPFMTASALPLDFMTVESSTRWLPRRPKPSAQSQGGCASSGLTTGQQPQSFGRRPIVCEPFRRVELSSLRFCFSVRECCVTDTIQTNSLYESASRASACHASYAARQHGGDIGTNKKGRHRETGLAALKHLFTSD